MQTLVCPGTAQLGVTTTVSENAGGLHKLSNSPTTEPTNAQEVTRRNQRIDSPTLIGSSFDRLSPPPIRTDLLPNRFLFPMRHEPHLLAPLSFPLAAPVLSNLSAPDFLVPRIQSRHSFSPLRKPRFAFRLPHVCEIRNQECGSILAATPLQSFIWSVGHQTR